jgi:hypothetical protein
LVSKQVKQQEWRTEPPGVDDERANLQARMHACKTGKRPIQCEYYLKMEEVLMEYLKE